MSNIRILGAYGAKSAIGGSSAFFLNPSHVLDAGNLLRPLRDKSADIEFIWITHSHLDHISDIAYILDNYYELRKKPLTLCALPETIKILKEHFFNNKIWPDFSLIPLLNGTEMSVRYKSIKPYEIEQIGMDEFIYAFKTDHTVPSCGYVIRKDDTSVLISADTFSLSEVILAVKNDNTIKTLVLECSFPSKMFDLAKVSKHLTAKILFGQLKELDNRNLKLYINHLKPTYEEIIKEEILLYKDDWNTTVLGDGDSIIF